MAPPFSSCRGGARFLVFFTEINEPRAIARGSLFIRSSDVVGVELPFGLAEILLELTLRFFASSLDVLALVVRHVAEIAAKLTLHLLRFSLDFVLGSACVQVLIHIPPSQQLPIEP